MPAFILLQYLLPQHALSRVVLWATRLRWRPFKNLLISRFVRGFAPDLSDADRSDPLDYESFNAFFTRALQPGARPLPTAARALASPVDGTLSQAGPIAQGQLLQAKGHHYSLQALLAGAAAEWSGAFADGLFATIYLAPYNYHRIHMPADGVLREAWHVPGALFSVNATTAAHVPGLFARNERVVLLFEGEAGPFAVILVGALFVGSMTTVWHGDVSPRHGRRPTRLVAQPDAAPLALARGAELGRFNMGSTVILLYGRGQAQLRDSVLPGTVLRMGETLGEITPP